MPDREARNVPEAWRPRPFSILVQIGLSGLGLLLVYFALRVLSASTLVAVVLLVLAVVMVLIARPWRLLPRSYEPLSAGGLDGRVGQTIARRPPSMLAGVGQILLGAAAIAGALAYTAVTWGQPDTGWGAALLIGGLGGAGLITMGAGSLRPSRRKDPHLVLTADGVECSHRGERTLLGWEEIGSIDAVSVGDGGRSRGGFTPPENLIRVQDVRGQRMIEWRCRSFRAHPVDVLELLRRRHQDAVNRH